MTKFIASVARRFAECADFLDTLSDDAQRTQRSHASELTQQARSARELLARTLDENAVPYSVAKRRAQIAHAHARVERNLTRSQQRHAKHLRQQALLAE